MIWVSKFRQLAKEKGWTEPYSLVFPVVFASFLLGFSVWRNGFDGSAQAWAGLLIVWVVGVVLSWFLFIVCMPKKWRDM
jgi:hypothetical protein